MRALYLETAAVAAELLGQESVARHWDGASVLPEFRVSGLAGHLARSVLQVEWYLDAEVGVGDPTTAAEYYEALAGPVGRDSGFSRAVRQRGEEVARDGPAVVAERVLATVGRLRGRLPAEPDDRRVEALGRVLLLDEYLKTRLVELTVHMEDLALSVRLPTPGEPAAAYTTAIETLVDAAILRSGPLTVLRALARAERQDAGVLRVL